MTISITYIATQETKVYKGINEIKLENSVLTIFFNPGEKHIFIRIFTRETPVNYSVFA